MFLKVLQVLEKNTYVADPQVCNFIKKRLQHKCFPVKFLRTPFSTEQHRWLLFKISNSSNSNKSVQRCFSDMSYAQPSLITCNSHNDKLIWKCIHLPKTCFHRKSFKKCIRRARGRRFLKKRTKTNKWRGSQAYLYVHSVKKMPDFQTVGRAFSDKLFGSC